MDEIFGNMGGRFEVSIQDCTMLWIVHKAMNKAQKKMNTKKGVIERLNQISKFYELAVMQLEGCLNFVKAETESSYLESNHEEVMADLREIKERLQGRLKESELAISEKDRELTERLENELKLRQALEQKDRELISLGVNLEYEKTRGSNAENDEARKNDVRDGKFCELKTCVDQQMLNIKEDCNMLGKELHNGIDNRKVEEMGSDIDILKETMDLAFGKMQNTLSFCEMGPKEQQWRVTIEKDIMSILIKSFLREFQENVEAHVRKEEKQIPRSFFEDWSQLMNEVTSLRHELASFISHYEMYGEDSSSSGLPSPTNFGQKTFHEMVGKPPSPKEISLDKPKRSSPRKAEVEHTEMSPKEEENEDGSNYVAKMIKNHESIIRQKSEELNWLKHGILQEKKALCSRRERELGSLRGRIQDVTARLDNLINWNSKLSDSLVNQRAVHEDETPPERKLSETDEETLRSAWEKIKGVSDMADEEKDEKRTFKKEKAYRKLQKLILEDTNLTLNRRLAEEIYSKSYKIEKLKEEDVCKYDSTELINQGNQSTESNIIEKQIREEVYFIVLSEAAKQISPTQDFVLAKSQDGEAEEHCLQDYISGNEVDELKCTIREDICKIIFKQMIEEYNQIMEGYYVENQIREETNQILFTETVKRIASISSFTSMQHREGNIHDNFHDQLMGVSTESLLKEDVCMVVLRSMLKEWKMELDNFCMDNLIKEQIHQFIMAETLKDFFMLSTTVKSPVQDTITEHTLSSIMLNQVHRAPQEENLIKILLESLLKCFEAEENLMLSAKSEIKERRKELDLGSECEELHEHQIFEDLLTEEEQTFYSLISKVENALQQLGISKTLLSELGTSLGLKVCGSEKIHHQITACEEGQSKPFCSDFLPLLKFSQIFAAFEGIINKKLQIVTVRLEKMKHGLNPIFELVDCLRSKELLYQKAFIRRCQNLHKAEAEVDLLADQVDALLTLLEKIYITLHKYAPVLQQYCQVSDILELIKKELIRGAT